MVPLVIELLVVVAFVEVRLVVFKLVEVAFDETRLAVLRLVDVAFTHTIFVKVADVAKMLVVETVRKVELLMFREPFKMRLSKVPVVAWKILEVALPVIVRSCENAN
jgi:hypothetical protein